MFCNFSLSSAFRAIIPATMLLAALEAPVEAMLVQPSLKSGAIMDQVERLKPGEFLWAPEVAPEGPVIAVISLATQRVVIYRNGLPIGISTVSTGRPGYSTPTGVFSVLQKKVDHRSTTYNNAPMPYMQRLTWRGVALHGGNLPGYPASHGCIRLPHDFARLLYGATRLGMTVIITESPAVPRIAPTPDLLRAGAASEAGPVQEEMSWHPERSPTGPVSIVLSGTDKRVIVLRNGRIIGSAPVQIRGTIEQASVYMLQSIDALGLHWLHVPLPGQATRPEQGAGEQGKFIVADEFRRSVLPILRPGTTVVVTGDSLRSGSAGVRPQTVMGAE